MIINMIVAMDKSNGIGLNNKLPWNFAKDMKFFKNKTIGNGNNAIIMGKNTFLSIGEKPLKGRKNYVISRTITSCNNNVIVLKDPDLITTLSEYDEVWIIGGSQLYNYFLSKHQLLNEIYITKINQKYQCDSFFPKVPETFKMNVEEIIIDNDKFDSNKEVVLTIESYKSK